MREYRGGYFSDPVLNAEFSVVQPLYIFLHRLLHTTVAGLTAH